MPSPGSSHRLFRKARSAPALLLGWLNARHRYQFGQLPEVLGGCCEEELIAGTIRSSLVEGESA